jgi:hypothetical protein
MGMFVETESGDIEVSYYTVIIFLVELRVIILPYVLLESLFVQRRIVQALIVL